MGFPCFMHAQKPLIAAVTASEAHEKTVQLLLKWGAKTDMRDESETTALMWAVQRA